MIPISDISLNDVLVEVGTPSGTEHEIGILLDEFNQYSTGAVHSANSFRDMGGFTGGYTWHYMYPAYFQDMGTDVRMYCNNWSNNAQSGTLYYEIYDVSDNLLASGGQASGSQAAETYWYMDIPFSAGTPAYIKWRWSPSLSWNTWGVSA